MSGEGSRGEHRDKRSAWVEADVIFDLARLYAGEAGPDGIDQAMETVENMTRPNLVQTLEACLGIVWGLTGYQGRSPHEWKRRMRDILEQEHLADSAANRHDRTPSNVLRPNFGED